MNDLILGMIIGIIIWQIICMIFCITATILNKDEELTALFSWCIFYIIYFIIGYIFIHIRELYIKIKIKIT